MKIKYKRRQNLTAFLFTAVPSLNFIQAKALPQTKTSDLSRLYLIFISDNQPKGVRENGASRRNPEQLTNDMAVPSLNFIQAKALP